MQAASSPNIAMREFVDILAIALVANE